LGLKTKQMNRLKNSGWLLSILCIICIYSCGSAPGGDPVPTAPETAGDGNGVHWMSFDQALKLNATNPKKIFIDVYTDWCGWCKKMDADTYTDPAIISYLNKYYYSVRLDAETGDTFHFQNHKFSNPRPHTKGYTNELASSLLDGKLGYPTTVYMDEKIQRLTYIQSYVSATYLMPVLKYFAENKYQTMKFDDYKKTIVGTAAK